MKLRLITLVVIICSLICLAGLHDRLMFYHGKLLISVPINTYKLSIERLEEKLESLKQVQKYTLLSERVLKFGNQEITVCYTDQNRFELDDVKKLSGRFFVSSDIKNKKPYAVINKKLAVAKFGNTDCIGEPLEMEGKQYKIIGVIDRKCGLESFIYNRPQIYLPIELEQTQYILIQCQQNDALWVGNVLEAFNTDITIQNLELDTYTIINKIKISFQGVIIILLFKLGHYTKKIINERIKQFRLLCKKEYLEVVLKKQIKTWWRSIICILGIIVLSILLFQGKMAFNPNYIPHTFGYGKIIKETFYKINNEEIMRVYLPTSYRQILYNLNQIINVVIVILISSLIRLQGYLLLKNDIIKENKKE